MNIPSGLLAIFFTMACAPCTGQGEGSYLVLKSGDTMHVPENLYINAHEHPQALHFRSEGRKQMVPATDVAALYRKRWVSMCYTSGRSHVFATAAIPTRTGYCHHFVQELFRRNDARVLRSVYCNQMDRPALFLQAGNGEPVLLGENNFRQLLTEHFSGDPATADIVRRKRYSPYRLQRKLW